MVANVLKFYQGAISYSEAMQMTPAELVRFNQFAHRINREIEEKSRSK